MTQFPHDQFVKDYLPQLLGDYGEATPALPVAAEIREIDVFFVPKQQVPTNILGLLGTWHLFISAAFEDWDSCDSPTPLNP